MAKTDIIIHDEKDNVGVVVIEKITPNQDCSCWIMENDKTVKIQSLNEIPLGHKIAMADFNEGDTQCGEKILEAIQMCWIDEK